MGMPNPNSKMALQNHLISKVSKLKIANLAPTSVFKLSTPLCTEFPTESDQHLLPWQGQTPPSTELLGQVLPPPWAHIWGEWSKPWVHLSRADSAMILPLTQAVPDVPWGGECAWGRWTPSIPSQGVPSREPISRNTSVTSWQPVLPGTTFVVWASSEIIKVLNLPCR